MRVGGAGDKLLERYGMTETGMVVSNPYQGDSCLGPCPLLLKYCLCSPQTILRQKGIKRSVTVAEK